MKIPKPSTANLVLLLATLLICCAGAEMTVRLLGRTDANGNFIVFSKILPPLRVPVESTRRIVKQYQASDHSRFVYDARLGWINRPGKILVRDGVEYCYNTKGMRTFSGEGFPPEPLPGTLRIALFGDSFTHGDEVPMEETWGAMMGSQLEEQGLQADVLNFGVGGYGIDQIYLLWSELGREFHPHVVIFGFQALDVKRNVSIIRPLFTPRLTGIPFSKPRFIFSGDELELVNSPALTPEQITGTLDSIESWDLAPHEFYYGPIYRDRIWWNSRLLALIAASAGRMSETERLDALYGPDSEPGRLALAIIDRFRDEAEAAGSRFLVLNQPIQTDLDRYRGGEPLRYQDLLDRIGQSSRLVRPGPVMANETAEGSISSLFSKNGHYSVRGNRIVADVAASELLELLQGSTRP